MLLIIANALMWAFLPALLVTFVTWRIIATRSEAVGIELTRHPLLRAAQIFLVWLGLFTVGFSVMIWFSFENAG